MPATSLAGRRLLLAPELLARALGDVLPFLGGVVLLRLARARVPRGPAIVLAGLGDAVALLLVAVLGRGIVSVRGAERGEARERGLQELAAVDRVHGHSPGGQSL